MIYGFRGRARTSHFLDKVEPFQTGLDWFYGGAMIYGFFGRVRTRAIFVKVEPYRWALSTVLHQKVLKLAYNRQGSNDSYTKIAKHLLARNSSPAPS